MYNGLKYFLTFALGAAAGAAVSCALLKKACELKINEEVEAFKEYWANKDDQEPETEEVAEDMSEAKEEYVSVIEDAGYNTIEQKGGSESMKIEVIPPEDFDTLDDWNIESFTYYEDHVLANDDGEIVHDHELLIGPDALGTFGEYEDDSVYVRNHETRTDYEILADMRKYADVHAKGIPNQADDE